MKNLSNKRKAIIIVVAIVVLVLTIGGAYALWTYTNTLDNQTLISGDIYMKYTEGNSVNIKEAMPSATYNPDEYFEFTVEGKNKYSKDVIYEILLDEGDEPTGDENKTRTERIKPELLKFRLVEVTTDEEGNEQEEELIQEASYDSIQRKRIWVDKVPAKTEKEIKYTYRLYMWISKNAKIGNMEGADYTAEVWNNNVFASVKVAVNGDFNPKDLTEDYMILNAINESGEKYDLKHPIQSDEDITVTLGSKREVKNFVVTKSEQYPIALMSLEEPTDYTASYNEATRAWEATITLDETGIYDYYAVYPDNKGNSKTYSFTILMNPGRFVLVEKPTSELCKQGLTYTGSPQDLIDGDKLDQTGYTITQVQGTDANSYEVKAKLKKNFRWADSSNEDAAFNCTIGPKETELTFEPTKEFKVEKGSKKTFNITAPTEGTFEVTSTAIGTASVEFTPSAGTSTTVTVQGVEIGSTSLDINFTPSNNNYTSKKETYNVIVSEIAVKKVKDTLGTGGLVGIPTNCSEGSCNPITDKNADKSIIREYRYSGLGVNNYVTFNNETWRIIGIFKDEENQEHLKIVRNSVLPASAMPDTYVIGETTFQIRYNNGIGAYWDYDGINYNNNWGDAGLMNWLNSTGTANGYSKTLSSTAQDMIAETKYYLGTLYYYYGFKITPIEAYQQERDVKSCKENIGSSAEESGCRVFANNAAMWPGKITLMYPSDYTFSADSTYWSSTTLNDYKNEAANTSWLQKEANHTFDEWLLSPSSTLIVYVAGWGGSGTVDNFSTVNPYVVRPSLYLKSNVSIISGTGESTSPYELQLEQ